MSTKTYSIYDGKILVNEGKNKTTYYYRTTVNGKRTKINLGHNQTAALQKLREIENTGSILPKTLGQVWESYSKSALLDLAPRTQHCYAQRWNQIVKIFNQINLEDIKPSHIKRYIRARTKALQDKAAQHEKHKAGVSANREIAVISILFTYAINELDYEGPNPCLGIKRVKEHGRDKYIENDEFLKIYNAADEELKDILDLLLETGQRISDVLKMEIRDIKQNADLTTIKMPNGMIASEVIGYSKADLLAVKTNKTQKKIDILIEGNLKRIIERILFKRKNKKVLSQFLLCNKEGKPFTYWNMNNKWKKAREQAGYKSFEIQLRDLRHKNATDDTAENANIRLAHTSMNMTESYRNNILGVLARPLNKD